MIRVLLPLTLVFFLVPKNADAQTPYYQGKTITITVGYQPGDGYDIWARLLAAHMGKHIASNPNLIAQNMPGAGFHDRGELHLQRIQAGRLNFWGPSARRFISISL